MKINVKLLVLCIAIPLLVGGLSWFFSGGDASLFRELNQPPLSPPGWVFGVVWTALYILMGIACYLMLSASAPSAQKNRALRVYALQLFFNYAWSILFFGWGLLTFSFIWLLALLALIALCAALFFRIRRSAGYLLLPYLAWVTFAGYLNLAIALIN